MDSGPCGGIQSMMIWCLCMHERVMLVAFSLNNEKSFNIDLWLIFPSLFPSLFLFLFFFFQDQEKMMIFSKSRNIGKLTTQSM